MEWLIVLVLLALLLGSLLMGSVKRVVSPAELKRRARGKDPKAVTIYKLMSYGASLDLLLWLVGSFAAAGLLVMAADTSFWLVAGLILVLGWVIWRKAPAMVTPWQWNLAAIIAPAASGLLSILQPVLGKLADWLEQRRLLPFHTRMYEKEDLLELLDAQNNQADNRIPEQELKIAKNALTFGDKTVGSAMTPLRVVKMVAATDSIGPHLMDELHGSGFSRFPVVKDLKPASPEIVGMLYLHDLVGHVEKGRVSSLMKKRVHFINETQTLRDALGAFFKTENHLLVVVNNFEETVGIITIEDVVEQILGEKIIDEFDQYDDMRAVAGIEARREESKHSTAEVVE